MAQSLEYLKQHARILHRRAQTRSHTAPPRSHFLSALARELGFNGWAHIVAVVEGRDTDFGTLLYPNRCFGFWNVWSADYDEASDIRATRGEYLLGYRRQFFVTGPDFITALGLEPSDPAWERIGHDWVRPADPDARDELLLALIRIVVAPLDPAAHQ